MLLTLGHIPLTYNSGTPTGSVVPDSFDVASGRGNSDFDARHRLRCVFNLRSAIQSGPRISGWEVASIVSVQTGNPFNIVVPETWASLVWETQSLQLYRYTVPEPDPVARNWDGLEVSKASTRNCTFIFSVIFVFFTKTGRHRQSRGGASCSRRDCPMCWLGSGRCWRRRDYHSRQLPSERSIAQVDCR